MASFSPNDIAEMLLDVEQLGQEGGRMRVNAKVSHERIASICREQGGLYEELCKPVGELGLSVRASNCLGLADEWCGLGKGNNIDQVFHLVARSPAELIRIRNLGPVTLEEIQQKLFQVTGLRLRGVKKL